MQVKEEYSTEYRSNEEIFYWLTRGGFEFEKDQHEVTEDDLALIDASLRISRRAVAIRKGEDAHTLQGLDKLIDKLEEIK